MNWARASALLGSVCLHGMLLAFASRHPAGDGPGPDAGGDPGAVFCAVAVSEPAPAPEPSLPAPTAFSPPEAAEAPPMPPTPQEPVTQEEMVLPIETGAVAAAPSIQRGHRIAAPSGARMARRAGTGGGGGGGTYTAPSYLNNPPPAYPLEARKSRHEGMVLLMVTVNEQGRAADVEVLRSSGDREMDRAAVEAVTRWTFHPAQAGGRTVAARVSVPIRFRLK